VPTSASSCLLCRTCANFLGRQGQERRRQHPRVCAAGLVLGPSAYHCDSYVRPGRDPKATPRPSKDRSRPA